MTELVTNELDPRFMGVVGMNFAAMEDSASRLAMYCSHIGQALVVQDSTIKRLYTGVEREYGKNIHDIRMPCDAIIIKSVPKYPKSTSESQVGENPLTTVIYENAETRELGVINLTRYHYIHQYFGFNYVYDPSVVHELAPRRPIRKDTVIATSPSITPAGDYKFGLEAQVALMSMPAVIEDGVIVSESFCKRMTTKGYGIRTVTWGKSGIPLNVHGNKKKYKIFPDIGERVGPDGLLFASRLYDDELGLSMLSHEALSEVDQFDKTIYAVPGAKVVDVIIYKGNKEKSVLPIGVDDQCRHYYRRTLDYHANIVNEYNRLKGDGQIAISPEFERLIVESMAVVQNANNGSVTPTYNRQPLDEWQVHIVFEYDVVPTVGFKITGMHGDKGIIVEVRPDEDMPVDALGNRAEVIMDGDSTIKRMNIGRLYEIYINASGKEVTRNVREMIRDGSRESHLKAWDYILDFYKTVSPPMYELTLRSGVDPISHVKKFAKDGHYIYVPTNNPVRYDDVVEQLAEKFPAVCGPVTYRGNSGRMVTTKHDVVIGGLHVLLLEKIGNTWNSVASPKLQHFGIPAKITNADKYASPGRHNPVRILGESEVRLVSAICGGETVAELIDQTNNPQAHKTIVTNILRADKPTAMKEVIDRQEVPRNGGRIVSLVNHILECGGIRFVKGHHDDASI